MHSVALAEARGSAAAQALTKALFEITQCETSREALRLLLLDRFLPPRAHGYDAVAWGTIGSFPSYRRAHGNDSVARRRRHGAERRSLGMRSLPLPRSLRVPPVAARLMVLMGSVASRLVLAALG